MAKRFWSVNAAAREIGCDRRTLTNALEGVPPDATQAGHGAWLLSTILKALRPVEAQAGDLDPAQERARKDRALAIATEIKNDLAIGRAVLADVALAAVSARDLKLRNKLLRMPTRIATRVPGNVQTLVATLVEEEILAAMDELTVGGEGHVTLDEVLALTGRAPEHE